MNHVLIVDDEVDIRDSLEAILREEDYTVTTAGTAREALTLVRDAQKKGAGMTSFKIRLFFLL